MTLKKEMCELSTRARAFSVEALIGVKRQRIEENNAHTDVQQKQNDKEFGSTRNKIYRRGNTSSKSQDEDESKLDSRLNPPGGDTVDVQQRLRLKQNLKVELCSRELWRKFHSLGTEMIITKAGRRMFPTVKVRLSGLDPAASYIVFLDIVPVDDKRYRYVYHSSQWMVAGSGDPPLPHNLYVHPDSPATGQLWMAQGVVAFDKLKLTNNRKPLVRGQVSLHSMHKYLPRVHILQTTDLDTPPEQQARVDRALTYTFPETTFTTVTAYQNQQITRLKIASNPFAKGFREASRTRDSLDDNRHQRPAQFPTPPLSGSSKFYPAEFFQLHPDFSLLPQPSTFFLQGRSLDPYCPTSMNVTPTTLYHSNQNPYGCHPALPPPLTMPVKFVVPPRNGNVVCDPTRRFCFEDSSIYPHENTKISTNVEHSKQAFGDNYYRTVSGEDNCRTNAVRHFQNVHRNNLSRKLSTDSHQSADSDDHSVDLNVRERSRSKSPGNQSKFLNSDDKINRHINGEHCRNSSPKISLPHNVTDERSINKTSNIQRFLAEPTLSVVHIKSNCEKRESKRMYEMDSKVLKMTTPSPLDLTKFK